MSTPREIAEAFSGHRFADAYPALAADVRWVSAGAGELTGRQAVIDACEATLAGLGDGTAEFLRFLVVASGDAVAVDTMTQYTGADGNTGAVSSCDVYEFRDGLLTTITSYTVEVAPEPATPA